MSQPSKFSDLSRLALLTIVAVLVHGYHPAVEDAAIYVPGIKKMLDPALYPYNAAFFTSHSHMTWFPNLVAAFVRISHLPFDWALLLLHLASIFFLLFGCLSLGRLIFRSPRAAWAGTALVAVLLTIPVAGTALYIFDEYLNPRSVSVPALLFMVITGYRRRWIPCALLAVFAAAVHPLMAAFGITYVALSFALENLRPLREGSSASPAGAVSAILLPFGLSGPVSDAYREILQGNSYFSVLRWEWYEWLGALAPLGLLWWFSRIGRRTGQPGLARISRDLAIFGTLFTVAAVVITLPRSFAGLTLLQPMRAFHLIYLGFFVIAGGLIADFLLQDKAWRWALLFLPIAVGMGYKQHEIFPSTHHLELPSRSPSNDWLEAFAWVRQNTPKTAYFALNPRHMDLDGEDHHGFRALAERSMLADAVKDRSAMSMFPEMAATWKAQAEAQRGWEHFQTADFARLKALYGVDWVLLDQPGPAPMTCPYQNHSLRVCRLQ